MFSRKGVDKERGADMSRAGRKETWVILLIILILALGMFFL